MVCAVNMWNLWANNCIKHFHSLSPWLEKILNFTTLKCSRMKDFHWFLENTFTMVKENVEFYTSEMLQNEGSPLISEVYLRHGWRKLWYLRSEMLQNEGFSLISGETFTKGVGFFPKIRNAMTSASFSLELGNNTI